MDDRLLVPATHSLLDGWCGPVRTPKGAEVSIGRVDIEDGPFGPVLAALTVRLSDGVEHWLDLRNIALDLSRAECRDRVARVLAAQLRGDRVPTAIAPEWTPHLRTRSAAGGLGHVNDGGWWHLWIGGYRRFDAGAIDALSALDPHDDARLPDGSRLVDALALAAVAREVLRG